MIDYKFKKSKYLCSSNLIFLQQMPQVFTFRTNQSVWQNSVKENWSVVWTWTGVAIRWRTRGCQEPWATSAWLLGGIANIKFYFPKGTRSKVCIVFTVLHVGQESFSSLTIPTWSSFDCSCPVQALDPWILLGLGFAQSPVYWKPTNQ